jgi:hypothetical protein
MELAADGALVYRFDVVTREVEALIQERARATDHEAAAGEVVFSSADAGTGIRQDPHGPSARPANTYAKPPAVVQQSAGGQAPSVEASEDTRPAVPRLEERREPVEFLERLMEESSKRRRE